MQSYTVHPVTDDTPEWFVLKVSRQEDRAAETLDSKGLRTYLPKAQTDATICGKKRIVERPLIPNTIFVHAPFRTLNAILAGHTFMSYCYRRTINGYKILKVPAREMERFIDSSTKMKGDITYYQPQEVVLKRGDKVRIVGGLFDGYEGTLLKAKGRAKRMFLINFEMLGAIGTHIEPQYIRLISRAEENERRSKGEKRTGTAANTGCAGQ